VAEAVVFLKSLTLLLPRKPVSGAVHRSWPRQKQGQGPSGYRELMRHLEHTHDQFHSRSPGSAGLVMVCFTPCPPFGRGLQGHPRPPPFPYPKSVLTRRSNGKVSASCSNTTAPAVLSTLREFRALALSRRRASRPSLAGRAAARSDGYLCMSTLANLIFDHMYIERRMTPPQTCTCARLTGHRRAERVVLDYGQCIRRPSPITNIFAGPTCC